jgi:DTW domain-containing protein YfiP
MMVFPAVSRITDIWTSGRTVRLNTANDVNRAYAESIGVADTPTFILFDASGQEQQRWLRVAPTIEELPQ